MERVNVFKRKRDGNVFHVYITVLIAISLTLVISSTADIKTNDRDIEHSRHKK